MPEDLTNHSIVNQQRGYYIHLMKKLLLILLLSFVFFECHPQSSDILLLKKKNGRTEKSYFSGSFIYFIDKSGREMSGTIKKIERDTLFIQYFDVRRAYNRWGTSVADTVTAYLFRYHYNEIQSIPKSTTAFEFVRDGTIFMIGGVGYAALHLINSAIQHEEVVGKTVAIAGGVAAAGFIMRKLRKKSYQIGKKYSLQYVNMQSR
jgi:hypothetical protein